MSKEGALGVELEAEEAGHDVARRDLVPLSPGRGTGRTGGFIHNSSREEPGSGRRRQVHGRLPHFQQRGPRPRQPFWTRVLGRGRPDTSTGPLGGMLCPHVFALFILCHSPRTVPPAPRQCPAVCLEALRDSGTDSNRALPHGRGQDGTMRAQCCHGHAVSQHLAAAAAPRHGARAVFALLPFSPSLCSKAWPAPAKTP